MHADVVGSTAMVQQDAGLAHERIQGAFRRLKEIIEDYGGAAHEVRGDALVAEFDKASDAVSAALTFQSVAPPDAGGDDSLPRLRIGIAMGEVIVADNTVTGAAAVLAQRLEQLAGDGEVVVQGAACESIPQQAPFVFESLGEHTVKGFERPVRAFVARVADGGTIPAPSRQRLLHRFPVSRRQGLLAAFVAAVLVVVGIGFTGGWPNWRSGVSTPVSEQPARPLPDRPSVAVLPLAAPGGDEQAYLADGLTEEIVGTLSRIDGLFVIARDSSFAYRGTSIGEQQVAAELGVRHLAKGSIDRAAETLEINLELLDARAGKRLVDKKRKLPWTQVLELESRLAQDIADALGVTLSEQQRARLARRDTEDPVAFDFYLRGQASFFRLTGEDNAQAREMYLRALDRDPQYAQALAALAMTYVNDVRFKWNGAGDATLAQAREVVDRALAADAELARVHLADGYVALLGHEVGKAIDASERAIALNPGLADARVLLADALTRTGEAANAVARMEEALRVNPYPPPFYQSVLGRSLYFAGRTSEASERLHRAVELDPNDLSSRVLLSAALGELGDASGSKRQARQVLTLDPGFEPGAWISRAGLDGAGRGDTLRTTLEQAGLESPGLIKSTLERVGLPSGSLELPQNESGRK